MNKYIKLIIVIAFCFITSLIIKTSYSKKEEFNLFLENKTNLDELKEDIYNYISVLDNYIMSNTSYNLSNNLNENYDFLVNFTCSYILNNSEFNDDIKLIDNIRYIDKDIIYDITYKTFNKKNFYIINDNKKIDNLIELKEVNPLIFNYDIDNIELIRNNDIVYANITYIIGNINYSYIYTFINDNNHLYIKNIEMSEDYE